MFPDIRKYLKFFQKFSITCAFLALLTIHSVRAQPIVPYNDQKIVEEYGFSSAAFDSLAAFLDEAGSSSMLILSKGKVVFEWGDTTKRHTIHSIRKPLISALYGIFIQQGIIDTSETLKSLNIDDINSLSEKEHSARLIDVLKSRSGVYHDAAANSRGMIANRPPRNSYNPGEFYFYNNWDFNVLGAILEQKTHKSVYELFHDEIAQKIGMEDYNGEFATIDGEDPDAKIPNTDGFYQLEPSKSNFPAYHFRLSARDMAKFGQLYLNNGTWEGQQIIPQEWIELSTQAYSITNERYGIGYGMLWYVLVPTEQRTSKSFYHTGNGVHFLAIYPASEMVVVHRVDTEKPYTFNQGDFYRMIDLVWASKIE